MLTQKTQIEAKKANASFFDSLELGRCEPTACVSLVHSCPCCWEGNNAHDAFGSAKPGESIITLLPVIPLG